MDVSTRILQLADYAVKKELIGERDRVWAVNRILEIMNLSEVTVDAASSDGVELCDILSDLCDFAVERGLVEDGIVFRDLFDTRIMGALTPRPSDVISKFDSLYKTSPADATDYFYKLARDCNYIRTDRIKKDMKWVYACEYGDIDITVNLSKPEKDPKAIAAAKLLPPKGYPKCLLCRENEGYAGTLAHPARQNLRMIPITVAGKRWYLQYSPYVYYNEHCIALSGEHTPMKIDRSTFEKQLDFVRRFPHYFLGSNADLPIVGGSILSHDHMQGGHYVFAMEKAPIEKSVSFEGFEDVEAGIVKWPMSVIRLRSDDTSRLIVLADKILSAWRKYSDPDAFVFANTDGEDHNTITPIARTSRGKFELDLVLRNNITTKEHPLGVFHPHAEHHNIKKENIGLIEVMGLAVLPSRLKSEIELMCEYILAGKPFDSCESIAKHAAWFDNFKGNYSFDENNVKSIIETEIGRTFVRVLEDAGVYKCTDAGRAAFERFVRSVK